MATVDDKVVAMSFESSKFESGVDKTINALNKLKDALKFPQAGKGLDDLNSSAQKVDLSHIGKAVDGIKSKFSAMSVVALSVLANVVNRAVAAGAKVVKALTIDPIIAGFKNYETQINAVQTILANTGLTGQKGLNQVNKALADLNKYANLTVYNFSEMTKNIGTFTAAGVDLKTATGAIKGIANLAALSGSNSQQAATAMYQLSQAISAGQVHLQDWNSVVNAGMGGTVFQRALAQTAEKMGTLSDGAVKLIGPMRNVSINGESFRQALTTKPGEKSWLTSDVLTKTLQQFTGDLSDAQLAAEGFNDAEIKAIQQQAKVAVGAATNIKTLSQLMDALKEEVATAWATIFKTIFGNITDATKLFSKLHTVAENALTAPIYALNNLLEDWAKLGGRTTLIDALTNAFKDLAAVSKVVGSAFREIFPATTGKQLYDMTVNFSKFVSMLKPSAETLDNLKRTFAGLFAILDIGKQLISGIFSVFAKLFSIVSSGGGGFLNLTGNIGDFLVSVDKALKKGDKLQHFFDSLANALAAPMTLLVAVRNAIFDLFSGFTEKSSAGFSKAVSGISNTLTPMQKLLELVREAWNKFLDSMGSAGQVLQPAFKAISQFFQNLGPEIANAVQNMNFGAILEVIRTGLLGGIFLLFKRFLGKGSFTDQLGKGMLGGFSDAFETLTGTLKAMQQNIKANTLLQIAAALGILTASIVALSFIDEKQLNASMSALTIAMGELLGAMAILNKIGTGAGFLKMPFITSSMIAMAIAIDLLVLAV